MCYFCFHSRFRYNLVRNSKSYATSCIFRKLFNGKDIRPYHVAVIMRTLQRQGDITGQIPKLMKSTAMILFLSRISSLNVRSHILATWSFQIIAGLRLHSLRSIPRTSVLSASVQSSIVDFEIKFSHSSSHKIHP